MALSIEELPVEIVDRRAKLALALGRHRDLRARFEEAALAVDEAALKEARARLVDADGKIDAAYEALRDATQRFGSDVVKAIQFMLEDSPEEN